jgi:hypothetical protein
VKKTSGVILHLCPKLYTIDFGDGTNTKYPDIQEIKKDERISSRERKAHDKNGM